LNQIYKVKEKTEPVKRKRGPRRGMLEDLDSAQGKEKKTKKGGPSRDVLEKGKRGSLRSTWHDLPTRGKDKKRASGPGIVKGIGEEGTAKRRQIRAAAARRQGSEKRRVKGRGADSTLNLPINVHLVLGEGNNAS